MRVNTGNDFQASVMSGASNATGVYAPANFIGVTANTAAPLTTDTTLAGEITSGTMIRKQATYAHTTGTSYYTLVFGVTADQTITIAKAAVFNALTGGTMFVETPLSTPVPLVSGNAFSYTETIQF